MGELMSGSKFGGELDALYKARKSPWHDAHVKAQADIEAAKSALSIAEREAGKIHNRISWTAGPVEATFRYLIDAPVTEPDWAVAAIEATRRIDPNYNYLTMQQLLTDWHTNPAYSDETRVKMAVVMNEFSQNPEAVVAAYMNAATDIGRFGVRDGMKDDIFIQRLKPVVELVSNNLDAGAISDLRISSAKTELKSIEDKISLGTQSAEVMAELGAKVKLDKIEEDKLEHAKHKWGLITSLRPAYDRRQNHLEAFLAGTAPRQAA